MDETWCTSQSLLAPIFREMLRYRSKWEIYSDLAPNCSDLVKHKGLLPSEKIGANDFIMVYYLLIYKLLEVRYCPDSSVFSAEVPILSRFCKNPNLT